MAFHYIEETASRMPVDLVLIIDAQESVDAELISMPNVQIAGVILLTARDKLLAVLANLPTLAPRFSTRLSAAARSTVRSLLSRNHYSHLRAEFSQAFAFAGMLPLSSTTRVVLSIHDIQAQLVGTKPILERGLFRQATFRSERRLLACADEILVLSEKDRESVIQSYRPTCPVMIQSVPLSSFVVRVKRVSDRIRPQSLLFWGAMGRLENERSLLAFLDQVFDPLRIIRPDLHLYVVGSSPSERVRRRECPNVTVTGFVEDPSSFFEIAQWGIVPLVEGAGIKLKTLEMLACGMPVLATPIGAEGIDSGRSGLYIRPIGEFFTFLNQHLPR